MGSQMGKWLHRLNGIDHEKRTATCAHCGPTSIRRTRPGKGWRCCTAAPKPKGGKTKERWHLLSEIDGTARRAVCSVCGPVAIRFRKGRNRWACKASSTGRSGGAGKAAKGWAEARRRFAEAQDGRCAICRRKRKLVLDHSHKTGRHRAGLCGSCNAAIGLLSEDPATIRAAADYVEQHHKIDSGV